MTKRYTHEPFTLQVTIRDDDGNLADPTSVAFEYRIGTYRTRRQTAVIKVSTGIYQTTINEAVPGNIYGTWTTQGTPERAIPAHVPLYPANGPNAYAA